MKTLPIDSRRLKSIASDIAQTWHKEIPGMEREAIEYGVREFHNWLIKNGYTLEPKDNG